MSAIGNPQRILNVYHHLADGTLPPDLWDESAELAAMVYLAVRYPLETALARLQAAVWEYNLVNRKLRLPQLPFDDVRAERKLTALSRHIASLPPEMHAGAVYRSILKVGLRGCFKGVAAARISDQGRRHQRGQTAEPRPNPCASLAWNGCA